MKNLNVGKKLVVVFGIVLTLFISTAVVSGFCLIKVSSSMKNFYNNQFQTVSTQYSMRVSLQATIRYLLWACTTEVDAETDDYIAKAAEQVEIMKNGIPVLMEKFQGDITLVQNFKAQMDATAPIRENLIAMAQSNHVEESLKMFNEQYVPMVTEAQENLIQIGEYATNHSKEIYKVSQRLKTQAVSVLVTSVIASLLIIIYFCRYITKNITQPILEIERAATDLAHGKLDTDVTYESKDELGILSQSLRSTIKIMAAIIEDISYMTSELAKGNFTVTTKAESIYKGSYRPILTSMRSMKEHLSSTMLQIGQAAEQVSSGSDQVSSAAQSLSQGATEQSSTVEALSGTISEISEQVENNARHAETASAKATHVGNGIMENNRQMQQMMKAMEHINKSSGEIGKIIKTIEDIAFQTNILALNAAVEAARAGESGKGFAVVADEVRNLASKSAEASKNTSALIEHSIKAVEEGSQIADMTAKSLVETVEGVKEVTNSIREISAASAAQAESILLITQNMDQISSVVQTNSATAEESAAASEELAGQAKILKELVSIFQLDGASASSNSDIVQTHYHNAASVSPVTTNHLKY